MELSAPFLGLLIGLVDLEIGRGGVVEDQIDIKSEQIRGLKDHLTLDALGPDGEETKSSIERIDAMPFGIWKKRDTGQPAGCTGELRAGLLQPVGRHGEE